MYFVSSVYLSFSLRSNKGGNLNGDVGMIGSFKQTGTDGNQIKYSVTTGDIRCASTDDTYYSELTEGGYTMLDKGRHDGQVNGGDTTQTLYSMADNVEMGQDDLTNIGYDVIPSITADDGGYDKLHVPKSGDVDVAANVYDHANPNTESTYDKLK